METITVTASITWSIEHANAFADLLGYSPIIPNPAFKGEINSDNEAVTNGEDPEIPNPESRIDFIKRKYKELSVDWFSQFVEREVKQKIAEESKKQVTEQVSQFKAGIESALTIK